ncbi:MAG: quinone-dependent dihydroorotate dehydrogenase [Alphaproteobacteria bacterium]|jgi:dihydroorotate dehydrogenase|nr:quinone-dependent dihydroorotate dehydrogenase [Alphaproteobacteria bacterium]
MDLFAIARPLLHALPPENAHALTLRALRLGLPGTGRPDPDARLAVTLWGRRFANPLGLAAGFDKNAEAVDPLLRLGFGFVEAGGVTPRPQPGNPPPRVFRLPQQRAMINRLGLNNQGVEAVARRLEDRLSKGTRSPGPVGINIAPNKDSPDPVSDYRACAARLAGLCDFLTVNVSSPNTPGLRRLQAGETLRRVLDAVRRPAPAGGTAPAVLVKIAPDLSEDERADIAAAMLAAGADGLVIANTTVSRPPGLPSRLAAEPGGLSGPPLRDLALATLRDMVQRTDGRLPVIGVGGIASGTDAYARIRAGASLVELYTALIYRGPRLLQEMLRELGACLAADGFASLADAVGADARNGRTRPGAP